MKWAYEIRHRADGRPAGLGGTYQTRDQALAALTRARLGGVIRRVRVSPRAWTCAGPRGRIDFHRARVGA